MAKQSAIDKALADIDTEMEHLEAVRVRLMAVKNATRPEPVTKERKPRKAKTAAGDL